MPRPGSGCSTRSRRDEVWEIKRQRFLAKQRGGGGHAAGAAAPPAARAQPTGDLGSLSAQVAPPQAKDSLSRLVAEGYPRTAAEPVTTHQPYGERPASGSAGGPRGMSGGPRRSPSSGGFDARVAGQWNANVVQDVQQRQNQHDPGVRGPAVHCGGQRVTQAPGGGASIDLSWNASQGSSASAHPPRMPGAGGQNYHMQPNHHQQQQYGGNFGQQQSMDYQRHSGRSMSPAVRNSAGSSPWGRDDDVNQRHAAPIRREAPPFGVDQGSQAAPRQSSMGPGIRTSCAAAAYAAQNAAAGRGRVAGHTPGGVSSVVFG